MVHEFFLVTMGGESVGCFRLFVPETIPHVLELGSVVSRVRGTGHQIVSIAENIAQEKQIQLVAITGGKLDNTLIKHGWRVATDEYPERMAESHLDKKLYIYENI